jgi:hypothetical protein
MGQADIIEKARTNGGAHECVEREPCWRFGRSEQRWVEVAGAGHDDVSGDPRYWNEIGVFLARLAGRPQ